LFWQLCPRNECIRAFEERLSELRRAERERLHRKRDELQARFLAFMGELSQQYSIAYDVRVIVDW